MGIAVYYLRKSFNPMILFSDMLKAWGIQKLAAVDKLGDYIFKVEFMKVEEKEREIGGGPWGHKGDAVIVVHYNGLAQPSEIKIHDIGLWVRLYDLPPSMMKELVVEVLGRQLGKFVKADCRYPRYLRIRVEYSLSKPLMSEQTVKVKGRGPMVIAIRYENVPHFCFSCERIGHAVLNCEYESMDGHGVRFGEELRASPPKRVKEIIIRPYKGRVARMLFQVTEPPSMVRSSSNKPMQSRDDLREAAQYQATEHMPKYNVGDIGKSSMGVHEPCKSGGASGIVQGSGGKERISFGPNMFSEEVMSDGTSG
jgi:hypothetical protein